MRRAELAAHGLTRRQLLGRGGVAVASVGGLAAAGAYGYARPRALAAAITSIPAPASTPAPDDTGAVLHFVAGLTSPRPR